MITKVQCKMLLYLCAYTDQASNGHTVINKVWHIIEPLNYVDRLKIFFAISNYIYFIHYLFSWFMPKMPFVLMTSSLYDPHLTANQ